MGSRCASSRRRAQGPARASHSAVAAIPGAPPASRASRRWRGPRAAAAAERVRQLPRDGLAQRGQGLVVVSAAGADDDGDNAAVRAIQCAAVEGPLAVRALPRVVEQRREAARQRYIDVVLQVDGADRLVGEAADGIERFAETGCESGRDASRAGPARRRVDDGVEAAELRVEPKAALRPGRSRQPGRRAARRCRARARNARRPRAATPTDRVRGSHSVAAALPAPRLSRSTFANNCADASASGVLSAAMHSGRQMRAISASLCPCSCQPAWRHRDPVPTVPALGLQRPEQARHRPAVAPRQSARPQQRD